MQPLDVPPLESMEAVARTPLWQAYLERNSESHRARLFAQNVDVFLGAMRRSGELLLESRNKVALGMTNEALAALTTLVFAPHRPEVLEMLLPYAREHTPTRR